MNSGEVFRRLIRQAVKLLNSYNSKSDSYHGFKRSCVQLLGSRLQTDIPGRLFLETFINHITGSYKSSVHRRSNILGDFCRKILMYLNLLICPGYR